MAIAACHPGWKDLLSWLKTRGFDAEACCVECRASPGAGYGLFAVEDAAVSAPLLTVPPRAMMNLRTLLPLYRPQGKQKPLTATQMISLHLCQHRPRDGATSLDTNFGPHISVLPTEFEGHPFTWRVRADTLGGELVSKLPSHIKNRLDKMHETYAADFTACRKYLNRREHASLDREDFLWAWLNVNTRCVYHRLKPERAHPDNLTLIPIIDFANHRPRPHAVPLPTNADIFDASPTGLGEPFSLVTPAGASIEAGEEVFFQYGRHSNSTLFVEYGFVNDYTAEQVATGDFEADADVQDLMEALFAERGEVGAWMRGVLEQEGYWGDWTLHSSPEPHPSFRILVALRLYHLSPDANQDASLLLEHEDTLLQPWRNVTLGRTAQLSNANETACRATLLALCERHARRGEDVLRNLRLTDEAVAWTSYAMHCVRKLWEEQIIVAMAVQRSVREGKEY